MSKAKLTMQDLDDAWAEMQRVKTQLTADVQAAYDWLQKNHFGINCVGKVVGPDDRWGHTPPHRQVPMIVMYHETYGPLRDFYTKILDKATWARKGKHVPGYPISEPTYEVDTPHGTYTLTFEYWDNHFAGV